MPDSRLVRQARPYFSGEVEAHATTLMAVAVRNYGTDFLEWDPITIQIELEEDFGVELPSEVFDKVMAAVAVLTTDRVYYSVPLFDEVINSFVGLGFSTDEDTPTVEELCLTVAEIYLLDPEPSVAEREHQRWSHDIRRYCRVILDDEGFSYAPRVLDFVPDRQVSVPTGADEPDGSRLGSIIAEQEARRDEIDAWVDQQVEKIVAELQAVGINPSDIE